MSKLKEILENKRKEVKDAKDAAKRNGNEAKLQEQADQAAPHRRNFIKALNDAASRDGTAIIAELKQKSPSTGMLTNDYNPAEIAKAYEDGGAACLSVLTDCEYFGGDLEHLREARSATKLPVLRKDFIIDPYQITESAAMGADAILLIAAALKPAELENLLERALAARLAVLLECHSADEIRAFNHLANRDGVLLGVNTRDLNTLKVDWDQALLNIRISNLSPKFRQERIVMESGIAGRHGNLPPDSSTASGIARFLVGTALMRAKNREARVAKLHELRGKFYPPPPQ